ncbi:MAG: HAD hydrolase family protein [Blautia sp.]
MSYESYETKKSPKANTCAFRDNDLDMLKTAGTAYRMGNDPRKIKNRIAGSAKSNDDSIVELLTDL